METNENNNEELLNTGSLAIKAVHDVLAQSFTDDQATDIITAIVFCKLWEAPIMAAWNKMREELGVMQNGASVTEEVPSD